MAKKKPIILRIGSFYFDVTVLCLQSNNGKDNPWNIRFFLIVNTGVASCVFQSNHFHNKLSEILDMVEDPAPSTDAKDADSNSEGNTDQTQIPVFEMQFPDLFVYWTSVLISHSLYSHLFYQYIHVCSF